MFLLDKCLVNGTTGRVNAYAKVNLTLDVTGKRADGYHDILSIMRIVDIYDVVTMELNETGIIELTTNLSWLPTDSGNIAYKAAQAVLEAAKSGCGVKIHIHKNIPCGAGMGGGSADGAAVLALLNKLMGDKLSEQQLLGLGAKIGADIPFCLMGGTCIASGIGEKLEPIKSQGDVPILVVKPEVSISTAQMYNVIDTAHISKRPLTHKMKQALEDGDITAIAGELCNVMEPPAIEQHSVIGAIRDKMLEEGASGAMMTGSGSAVFGIFETVDAVEQAAKAFENDYKDVYCTTMM